MGLIQKSVIPGMCCLALLAATAVAYGLARQYEARRLQTTFDQLAATKAQRVLLRVEGYERSLIDLRGLFIADNDVTEAEFRRYLDGVDVQGRYPALLRIGYAPLVTPQNLARLQTRFAAKGNTLKVRPDGQLQAPVLYGYPFSGGVFGQDLNADPARHASLLAARDANSPRLSAAVTLRFDAVNQPGYLLYVPLYQSGILPATLADRQRTLAGFLYAAFRADELVFSTIQDGMGTQFHLSLYDGDTPKTGQLVFSSMGSEAAPAADIALFSIQRLNVGGRPWSFVFQSRPDFVDANQSLLPASMLAGGLIISLLGFGLAWFIRGRLAAESHIRYLAFHDELTGLPNRTLLCRHLERAIDSAAPEAALLIVELTRFKDINYTFGHAIGDALLRQAGARIRSAASHCIVARIGNVQFGVLANDRSRLQAQALAERLVMSVQQPLPVHDISYEVGAHIGIALYPEHGKDADRLMRHADVALNQARTMDLGVVLYDQLHDPYQPRRLSLLTQFRQALKNNEIELYCQPKANLRTGAIGSVEALVRWRHPSYGLVPPDEFIPLIEPTALVHPLTQHVLRAALEQSRRWRDQRFNIKIAINLSTRNLLNPLLPHAIGELLRNCGAEPGWIELEITESSLMRDPAAALTILQQLRGMGLTLAVDDFGTGYSGLDYLLKFPIDTVKIDRAFTAGMTDNRDAAAIVKSTIGLAHDMGLQVVAEGIENRQVWDALAVLGCDEAQGYYVSAPMPMGELPVWLEQSPWRYAGVAARHEGRR